MGKTNQQAASDVGSRAAAERRKSTREALVVRVEYETIDELFSDFAHNINEGGLFVESDTPRELGSSVSLQFRLPGSEEPITARGIVVHVTEGDETGVPGMGIEFEPLDADTRQRVNELVKALRSR
ncbi:MAG: TIGR02266 family protein [Deltaproteobacteria bacterium]|nr:TIGR02266 family protein [Deltaproteobacteria bacterium]MBW2360232.1 TIGR02266 family protein [Deltaproteobacteria bacterium]